jgi:signal transduction histidine kinase/DNA-binding NarL/FixJ family response regulator
VRLINPEHMATILIVEDRPRDRQFLTALLRTQGHKILEASDGQEALDALPHVRPDVVINDILMPTVDGCEFVRRMRDIPGLGATPVIFRAATYHVREARALAHQCGAFDVLAKPGTPHEILATVDAALGSNLRVPHADRASSGRERQDDLRSTPTAGIDGVQAEKQRMTVILDIAKQLVVERDPVAMLDKVCIEARHVTLAQHAIVGLVAGDGSEGEVLSCSGLDAAAQARLKPRPVRGPLLTTVVREGRAVRLQNPAGRPEALGLPAEHPAVSSLLSVPIATSSRVYGWLNLGNKLGMHEFTEADERLAATLGAHAGIAYENADVFRELNDRIASLEQELQDTSARIREEERAQLSRTLHDHVGQVLAGLKFDLHWLVAQLIPVPRSSSHDITRRFDSMQQRLNEAIESVRRTANELRPAVMDTLGFVAAIESHAEEFERRSGIRCVVDCRIVERDLEPPWGTAIFRIVQEALTNVLQHAHATRATITMRRSAKSLTVSVADNGRGISDSDLTKSGSLGLLGMRERATLLGGRVDVLNRKPKGTTVRVTVPFTRTRTARE